MKKFFKDLLSGSSDTSSKRFASLLALAVVISLAYIAAYKNEEHVVPEFMFDSIALIAGGGLGLTVIENVVKMKQQNKNNTPNNTPTDTPIEPEA
jgi:hypothetical protein